LYYQGKVIGYLEKDDSTLFTRSGLNEWNSLCNDHFNFPISHLGQQELQQVIQVADELKIEVRKRQETLKRRNRRKRKRQNVRTSISSSGQEGGTSKVPSTQKEEKEEEKDRQSIQCQAGSGGATDAAVPVHLKGNETDRTSVIRDSRESIPEDDHLS